MSGGVSIYVGTTQMGKTTKALADLRADVDRDGRPSLILDLGPAKNFIGMPHERSVRDVLVKLYGEGTHAVYTPKGGEDFDRLMNGIAGNDEVNGPGGVHVLMDEVRWVASAHKISYALTRALRHWAHGFKGPVTYRCTSQRPGDLHRDFYACLTGKVYAFKTPPGPDQDRLVDEYRFDAEQLGSLTVGRCLEWP